MQRLDLSSNKTLREESRLRTLLWPSLSTKPGIESVIDIGKITAYVVSGLTLLFIVFRAVPTAGLLDVFCLAGFGYGIGRRSRTCAILALILYLSNLIFSYLDDRRGWSIITLIIILIFMNTVRGTFAYHRLLKKDLRL